VPLLGSPVQSADTSLFEHCAEIVQSLVPRVQAIGVLGPAWHLIWTSDPAARTKIGAAVAVLGNPSREPAISDKAGVSVAAKNSVYFLWLRGPNDTLAGILAIVWPSQPPRGKSTTLAGVSERLAPVLALLGQSLNVAEKNSGTPTLAETAEFKSLEEAMHAGDAGDLAVDPIDSMLAAFNRLAPCDASLLMVPSWCVDRCVAPEGWSDAQVLALRELATTYLWPAVRDQGAALVLNKARFKGAESLIPFRVVATPIERRKAVIGVLVACRPNEGVKFGQREKRLNEKLAGRLLEIIEAGYDEATGLLNRQAFEAAIDRRLSISPQIVRCLVYCDLDQLHVINDLFGFDSGDQVLRGVARCWERSGMPSKSLVSRLAGDRFVALLENCTLNQARTWADQFRKSIEQRPALESGTGVKITASIGVVAMTEGSTLDHGLAAAETACKAAKDRGRNRVELFADSDQSLMRRFDDMGVFRRVVEALGAGGFTLFAQPIVPLRNRKRPTSYELLVRMNGTDGSALAPDMFFSAATRYQLLPKLDRWVLNETMKQLQPYAALLAEWNISFAINISGQSLGDSEFTDFARSTLKGSGIDPKWITLEITESAAIGNLEIAKKFISRMTALGCRFALDDFGTGLSSLAYLKELAVSSIKIDGVFVRDLLSSSRSEAMIEAVMTIAHELRLDTVAEFVESQEISERLMAFGVTHGQGYAFGRPEPLKALLASLAAGRQPDQDLRKQAGS